MNRCFDGLPDCNRGNLPPEKKPYDPLTQDLEVGLFGITIHPFQFGNGGRGRNIRLNFPKHKDAPKKEARLDAFFCPAGKHFDKRYYDGPSYLYADKNGFMFRSYFENCWEIETWDAVT